VKILFVNAGNETGGGRTHMVQLIKALNQTPGNQAELLVFEDGPVAQMARANHEPVTVIPQKSQIDISVLSKYRQFVAAGHFDIVHSHGPRANVLTNMIRKKITAKWVVTVHSEPHVDFPRQGLKGKLFLQAHIHALRHARHLFLITDYFRPELRSDGIPDHDMTEIFNAISFDDTSHHVANSNQFELLNVARLAPVKNQALLLSALHQVSFPYHLNIVGDGITHDELARQITDLGLTKQVTLAGFHKNTANYYRAADLFVLPSDSEGFPTVLLEAANWELPAIATDVGSDKKVIHSVENGWVIPMQDEDALVNALNDAYADYQHGLLPEKGRLFKTFAAANFSVQRLAQVMLKAYAEV
jgi:glycosyltransferase involved in cell wall biosynthesis